MRCQTNLHDSKSTGTSSHACFICLKQKEQTLSGFKVKNGVVKKGFINEGTRLVKQTPNCAFYSDSVSEDLLSKLVTKHCVQK